MSKESLSLRGYAAHRRAQGLPGGTLKAVQRAIDAERISVVTVNGAKRIPDPEAADREWAANTDHTRAPGYVKELGDGLDEDLEDDELGGVSLRLEAALDKRASRLQRELRYRREAGLLVEAAAMEATMADDYTLVRNGILGLPSKAKQRLPHLTLDDLATLEEIVREVLEPLATGEP